MTNAAEREEKALRQLTDRLVQRYRESHSADAVREVIDRVRRTYDGHRVREFVPVLVERIATRELDQMPVDAPEQAAPQPVAETPDPEGAASADTEQPSADMESVPAEAESVLPEAESAPPEGDSAPPDSNSTYPTEKITSPQEDSVSTSDPSESPEAQPPASATAAATPWAADEPSTTTDTGEPEAPRSGGTPGDSAAGESADSEADEDNPTDEEGPALPETDALQDLGAMIRRRPREFGLLTAAVLVVTVLICALTAQTGAKPKSAAVASAPTAGLTTVHGVVGSEKMNFFTDPKVVNALARKGIAVHADPAGSRQIATSVDLGHLDFAFPSSSVSAERIQRKRNITTKYTPFSSPMVVASFGPIVDLLTKAGIVHPGPTPNFDMQRFVDLAQQGTRWNQLDGNTSYPVDKNILLSTTDPRTSNSASMYLAVAAYVANDNSMVQGPEAENFVLSKVARLFTKQGYTENSSEGPFIEYLTGGMGPTPMVWGYESQYVEAAAAGKLPADSVLMYPSPTVISQHTLIPLTSGGDRLGQLLTTDPELQRLAAEHGFRTADRSQFGKVVDEHKIPVAPNVVNVVDTPSYDTFERLLDGVAQSYN
ncbi:MAG: hypothetical protein J2P18_11445 [Nocardia sp.]|nr:hypothetical protein [Nocardia sp.]